jgi:hypothetical protein
VRGAARLMARCFVKLPTNCCRSPRLAGALRLRLVTPSLSSMYLHLYHVVSREAQLFPTLSSSCEACFAGLSPWFAPVVVVGGLQLGLVRRAVSVFAPRSTPNKLLLTAVRLFSQGRVAAWPLAVATGERQHAIPHCLGSRAAFQAFLGPISTRLK